MNRLPEIRPEISARRRKKQVRRTIDRKTARLRGQIPGAAARRRAAAALVCAHSRLGGAPRRPFRGSAYSSYMTGSTSDRPAHMMTCSGRPTRKKSEKR